MPTLKQLPQYLTGAAGLWFLYLGLHQWVSLDSLPRQASARICGNCQLASVACSLEPGAILLTPWFVGIPMYLLCFLF